MLGGERWRESAKEKRRRGEGRAIGGVGSGGGSCRVSVKVEGRARDKKCRFGKINQTDDGGFVHDSNGGDYVNKIKQMGRGGGKRDSATDFSTCSRVSALSLLVVASLKSLAHTYHARGKEKKLGDASHSAGGVQPAAPLEHPNGKRHIQLRSQENALLPGR